MATKKDAASDKIQEEILNKLIARKSKIDNKLAAIGDISLSDVAGVFNTSASSLKNLKDDLAEKGVEFKNKQIKANLDRVIVKNNPKQAIIEFQQAVKKSSAELETIRQSSENISEFRVILTPFELTLLHGYIDLYKEQVLPRVKEVANNANSYISASSQDDEIFQARTGVRINDANAGEDVNGYIPANDIKNFFIQLESHVFSQIDSTDESVDIMSAFKSFTPPEMTEKFQYILNTMSAVLNVSDVPLKEMLPNVEGLGATGDILSKLASASKTLLSSVSKIDTAADHSKNLKKIDTSEFEALANSIINSQDESTTDEIKTKAGDILSKLAAYKASNNITNSKVIRQELRKAIADLYDVENAQELAEIVTFSERAKNLSRKKFVDGLRSGFITAKQGGQEFKERSLISETEADQLADFFYASFADMPRIYQTKLLEKIGFLNIQNKTGGIELASLIRANLANMAANITRKLVDKRVGNKPSDAEIIVPLSIYQRGERGASQVVKPSGVAASLLFNALPSEFSGTWEYIASVSQQDILPSFAEGMEGVITKNRALEGYVPKALTSYGGQTLDVLTRQKNVQVKNQLEKDHNYALSRGNLTLPFNMVAIDANVNSSKGDQDTIYEQLIFSNMTSGKIFTDNRNDWVTEAEEAAAADEGRETATEALEIARKRIISPQDEIDQFEKEKKVWKSEKRDLNNASNISIQDLKKNIEDKLNNYIRVLNGPDGINAAIQELKSQKEERLKLIRKNAGEILKINRKSAEELADGVAKLKRANLPALKAEYEALQSAGGALKGLKGKGKKDFVDSLKDAIKKLDGLIDSIDLAEKVLKNVNSNERDFAKRFSLVTEQTEALFDAHIQYLVDIKKAIISNAGDFKETLEKMNRDFFRNQERGGSKSLYNPRKLNDYITDITKNIKDYETKGIKEFKKIEQEFKALSREAQLKLDPNNLEPTLAELSAYLYKYVQIKEYLLVSSSFY